MGQHLDWIARQCERKTNQLEALLARKEELDRRIDNRRSATLGTLRKMARGEEPAYPWERRDPEATPQEAETFRRRRADWGREAARLPHNRGEACKVWNKRNGSFSYSFLGAGLQAMINLDPGRIQWNEMTNDSRTGEAFQTVDDTTETLADHYGISTELVDLLDELDQEGCPVERLIDVVDRANLISGMPPGAEGLK